VATPLSNVRVLDLTRVLAGPWCAQTLADLGAEVIKVEKPGVGDDTRGWGPPFIADPEGKPLPDSAYFFCANRGKKSLTLDISRPEGQDIARKLAAKSDIFLENYKVGGLARYGLGYEDLRKINPRLIYCSITGFGQDGPYKDRAGYDFMIQGMAGMMSVTGERDDRPGGGPQKIGVALTDILTGLYTTIGALAALNLRERTGEGQHVDMALMDVLVAAMANQAMNYLITGMPPVRMGNAHPNIVPYESFKTADDYVIVAIGNDAQFRRFCEVGGRTDLAEDPRFATNAERVAHRETLLAVIREFMAKRPRAFWLKELERVGIPSGPINDLAQVFADPQVQARGLRMELPHPQAGHLPQVANPIRYSAAELAYSRAGPTLGQDTDDILRELLGFAPHEIARLRSGGIV
jgi:crotonobetainyl-CoA:carnitine CoA-transferase CaiB-like acyl-CoA transferase